MLIKHKVSGKVIEVLEGTKFATSAYDIVEKEAAEKAVEKSVEKTAKQSLRENGAATAKTTVKKAKKKVSKPATKDEKTPATTVDNKTAATK